MSFRPTLALAIFGFTLSSADFVHADTSALSLARALSQLSDGGARFLQASGTQRAAVTPLIVRVDSTSDAERLGLLPVTRHLALGWAELPSWGVLALDPAVKAVRFSPSRAPLMDRASLTVHAPEAHEDYGLGGEGTIVGIVDTGFDSAHPSLRHADGSTRVSWLLAFEQEPRGVHVKLETAYGCTGVDPCAVYSADDINGILTGTSAETLPVDDIGHGTHIASIAAGSDGQYGGIAPAADLIIVAAADATGGVTDGRILLGTRFVFDRATEENKPAVVNVSLGSNFGAHDGSSAIEQGLAELGAGPGRAVVTAAGNEGEFTDDLSPHYPGPFGIHTEVAVPSSATVRIPLLTSMSPQEDGAVFIWISTRPGDELSLGFHNGQGGESPLVEPGDTLAFNSKGLKDEEDDYDVVILNGADADLSTDIYPGSSVVALTGRWEHGRVFELVLEGSASARLWATGAGAAQPLAGKSGPVFPRARLRGTVAVPGSDAHLITVGATVNRPFWTDYEGNIVGPENQSVGRAGFSSAGPNQLGALKPELVAPGAAVIAAMSKAADPRTGENDQSIFSAAGSCPGSSECFVIDDEHGISSGTSMAAPMVTGAIALLMGRDPELTMEGAKYLLMTGTQSVGPAPPGSLVGTGELDILGAILAQESSLSGQDSSVSPAHSRLVWADNFVRPSTSSPLLGTLLLRGGDDRPTDDGMDELNFRVSGPGRADWRRIGIGLVAVELRAEDGSGAQELQVEVTARGQLIDGDTMPIALDPILAKYGFELAGGSCSVSRPSPAAPTLPFLVLSVLLLKGRRRKKFD
jgi:subtilisin family serine protease